MIFADILVLAVGCIAIVALLTWGCRRAVVKHTPAPQCDCDNCVGAALAQIKRKCEVEQ